MLGETKNITNTDILDKGTTLDAVSNIVDKIQKGITLSISEETFREQNTEEIEMRLRELMGAESSKKILEPNVKINYVDILKKISEAEAQIAAGITNVVLDDIPFDVFKQITQNNIYAQDVATGNLPKTETKPIEINTLETEGAVPTKNINNLESVAKEYSLHVTENKIDVETIADKLVSQKNQQETIATAPINTRPIKQDDTLHSFMSRELGLPLLVSDIGGQYSLLESIFTEARQQTDSVGETVNSFEKNAVGSNIDITYFVNALNNKRTNNEPLVEHVNSLPTTVTMRVVENMPRKIRESLMIVNSLANNKNVAIINSISSSEPSKTSPDILVKKDISQKDLLKYIINSLAQHELNFKNIAEHSSSDASNFLKTYSDEASDEMTRRASVFVFEISRKADIEPNAKETVLQFIQRAATKILEESE